MITRTKDRVGNKLVPKPDKGHMRTAHEIKYAVASYFRYERQAALVSTERPIYGVTAGVPDVLVCMPNRKLVEIEVKVSMSDFRADAKKYKWKYMKSEWAKNKGPSQFYYAVPTKLVEKVKAELPEGAGLISCRWDGRCVGGTAVVVERKAPVLHKTRLDLKSIVRMAKNQTGTLCSMMRLEAKRRHEGIDDEPCLDGSHI